MASFKCVSHNKGLMVFRKDFVSKNGKDYSRYSLGISSKNRDGSYTKGYFPCVFKGGKKMPNKAIIRIDESYMAVSEYEGNINFQLVIMEWQVLDMGDDKQEASSSFMNIADGMDDELPFG